MNRILCVVRTPQIGHKIDLKFLTQAFRTALPPIAQDEAGQALAAVTDFSRRSWRPWADAVIRAAADPVAIAASALTQITRAESAARETVNTLTLDSAAERGFWAVGVMMVQVGGLRLAAGCQTA